MEQPKQRLKLRRELSHEDTATILAALRFWQEHRDRGGEVPAHFDHFEDTKPLTVEEIDKLCEDINLGPDDQGTKAAEQFRELAKEQHVHEGTLEIDPGAIVSFSDSGGAYVAAWVWVDGLVCRTCGRVYSQGGDGYDEECGDCADKADKKREARAVYPRLKRKAKPAKAVVK